MEYFSFFEERWELLEKKQELIVVFWKTCLSEVRWLNTEEHLAVPLGNEILFCIFKVILFKIWFKDLQMFGGHNF